MNMQPQNPVAMQQSVPQQQPSTPQQAQQMQQQAQPNPQPGQAGLPQAQEKLDNISKVKSLIVPLKDQLAHTLRSAGHLLHHNTSVDIGSSKGGDPMATRFDVHLEEFYSICDLIELHLKTAIECLSQGESSSHYLPLMVLSNRSEAVAGAGAGGGQDGRQLYPQYLATVRAQINFSKQVHDALILAAENIHQSTHTREETKM